MRKNPNNNILNKKSTKIPSRELDTKKSPWLEDYAECFSFKIKPVTHSFIARLAQELDDWSKTEQALVFRDFWDNRNIPEDAFYRWARTYPDFGAAVKMAKGRIGSRREKGGITRKFDSGFVLNTMPMYDSEYKEFMQWKAALKAQEATNEKVVIEINDLSKKVSVGSESKE